MLSASRQTRTIRSFQLGRMVGHSRGAVNVEKGNEADR